MVKARVLNPKSIFDFSKKGTETEVGIDGKTSYVSDLVPFFSENGIKEDHCHKLLGALVRGNCGTLEEAQGSLRRGNDLPHAIWEKVPEKFAVLTSRIVETQVSKDGTTKLLIELQDGKQVESVIMKHDNRITLCVSSQVGCQMACTFCATGTMGLKGHLTCGEILEQLLHANRVLAQQHQAQQQKEKEEKQETDAKEKEEEAAKQQEGAEQQEAGEKGTEQEQAKGKKRRGGQAPVPQVRNVVFMGMGEPLDNYDSVVCAAAAMVDERLWGLGKSHVTISTVGVVKRIAHLAQDLPGLNLALSLHAPTQELRLKLVPSGKAFKLPALLAAADSYMAESGRPIMIEYVVIHEQNDGDEHAHQLGNLLQGRNVILNLIPYNSTEVVAGYQAPETARVRGMQKITSGEYSIKTTVRQEMGQDIAGACGQLALKKPAPSHTHGAGGTGSCGSNCTDCNGGGGCASGGTPATPGADIEDIFAAGGGGNKKGGGAGAGSRAAAGAGSGRAVGGETGEKPDNGISKKLLSSGAWVAGASAVVGGVAVIGLVMASRRKH